MVRQSRFLLASFVLALAGLAVPAQAQDALRVAFKNDTPNCVWVTFYRRDASGIGGTLADPVIIQNPRSQTGPLAVKPKSTFGFTLPRPGSWLRIRTETMNANCRGNVGGDTSMQATDARNIDAMHFTLHGSQRSIYLSRP